MPNAFASSRNGVTCDDTWVVAMTLCPLFAMPIDAALPNPEPAPVTRIRLLMTVSLRAMSVRQDIALVPLRNRRVVAEIVAKLRRSARRSIAGAHHGWAHVAYQS